MNYGFHYRWAKETDFPAIAKFYSENCGSLCPPASAREEEIRLIQDRERLARDEKKILMAFENGSHDFCGYVVLENKHNNFEVEAVHLSEVTGKKGYTATQETGYWIGEHAYRKKKTLCGEKTFMENGVNLSKCLQASFERLRNRVYASKHKNV